MGEDVDLDSASRQLDRVLTFFPRVDAKSNSMFAINIGILAFAAVNLHFDDLAIWYIAIPAVAGLALAATSLAFVYQGNFPNLRGGAGSLVYFSEIAARTEQNFVSDFIKQTSEAHARDLLSQAWRNSEILKIKFHAVKASFITTALSIVPWCAFLIAESLLHSQVPKVG